MLTIHSIQCKLGRSKVDFHVIRRATSSLEVMKFVCLTTSAVDGVIDPWLIAVIGLRGLAF